MALPSSPVDGQYVRPSDDVVYRYNEADNSYRTFNAKNAYVNLAEYSYRYKNANGNITAPFLDNDDVLTIEIPYSFKQEIYNPIPSGGFFSITLPESIPNAAAIPTTIGTVNVNAIVPEYWATGPSVFPNVRNGFAVGELEASLFFGGELNSVGNESGSTYKFNGTTTTSAGNIIFDRFAHAGAGVQNAAVVFGGSGVSPLDQTEKYNGSAWFLSGDLSGTRMYLSGCGFQLAALSVGGKQGSAATNITEEFNGVSWSAGGNLNTARQDLTTVGFTNAAISVGGTVDDTGGTATDAVENYNGTSWSIGASINSLIRRHGSVGEQNSCIIFGGFDEGATGTSPFEKTQRYNGSTWSYTADMLEAKSAHGYSGITATALSATGLDTVSGFSTSSEFFINPANIKSKIPEGDFSLLVREIDPEYWTVVGATLNASKKELAAVGTVNSAVAFGGETTTTPLDTAELFDGASWTLTGSMNNAENELAGAGIQNAALSIGGNGSNVTEKFDGSVWTTNAGWNLATNRYRAGAAGLQDAAVVFGGFNNSVPEDLDTTEKFDGSTWTSSGALNGKRQLLNGCGTQNAALAFNGSNIAGGINNPIVTTEKFDGSTWSLVSGGNINEGKLSAQGSGEQNAALSWGGYTTFVIYSTEKFNGYVWSLTSDISSSQRYRAGGDGTQADSFAVGGATSGTTSVDTTEIWNVYLSENIAIYNKGQNNPDYPFGTDVTISGDQLVVADALALATYPIIEVSYLPSAKERDGISIFADFDIKNLDDIEENEIELVRVYNSIDPEHYARFYFDKSTNFYEIFYSNYNSSTDNYSTGNAVGSTVRSLTSETIEIRMEDFFNDTFSVWNTKLDLYTDREENVDVTDNAFPDNLFYDTIEILKDGQHTIGEVAVFYGNSRIDILSQEINYNLVQPDVYYEIKEYGEYIIESDNPVTYTIANNGNVLESWWALGAEMNTARRGPTAIGTQNSALGLGGFDPPTNFAITEKFNGSAWTTDGAWNLNAAKRYLGGAGSQNEALAFGGYTASAIAVTEKFNGSSWSTNAGWDLNTAKLAVGGVGSQNAALCFGGDTTGSSDTSVTEKFNGSSWSTNAGWDLNSARDFPTGAGTQNAALTFSGNNASPLAVTEKFDGNSWSNANSLNTARRYSGGAGSQNTALAFGGDNSGVLNSTEKFDGNSWSTQATWNLNVARELLAGAGAQNSALAFGGSTGVDLSSTELFQNNNSIRVIRDDIEVVDDEIELEDDSAMIKIIRNNSFSGGAWSISGNLNETKRYLGGAGSQNATLSIGGYDGTNYLATTEKFNGSSWTTNGAWDLNVGVSSPAGVGIQSAALSIAGNDDNPGIVAAFTEKFDGSSWSTNAGWDLNVARQAPLGAGSQNAALVSGGDDAYVYIASTEKFDGSSWSTQAGWDLNTGRGRLGGVGTQNAALSFGGSASGSPTTAITEKFNGDSWTIIAPIIAETTGVGGSGSQNAALLIAGDDSGPSDKTEKFNGYYWALSEKLNVVRIDHGTNSSLDGQNSSVAFGGFNIGSNEISSTELFNYTPEVIATITY